MPGMRGFFDGGETQNGRRPDRELQVLEMSQGCECDEGIRKVFWWDVRSRDYAAVSGVIPFLMF